MRSVSQYSTISAILFLRNLNVVALAALCENITAYLGDHKIALRDEVYGPRPVLSGEQSKKRFEQARAYGVLAPRGAWTNSNVQVKRQI
jgi:hypothetical protein